jgi:hypothetical protein
MHCRITVQMSVNRGKGGEQIYIIINPLKMWQGSNVWGRQ